jgi:hypothetical protein
MIWKAYEQSTRLWTDPEPTIFLAQNKDWTTYQIMLLDLCAYHYIGVPPLQMYGGPFTQ